MLISFISGIRGDLFANYDCPAALDGHWSTVEKTGTGTGRNGSGTGETSDRKAQNGYRSITVFARKVSSGNDSKI